MPMLRIATFIVLGLATVAWLSFVGAIILTSEGELGYGYAVIYVTGRTFLAFALPAVFLAWKGKLLGLALALALLSLVATVLVA